jgi:Xaa-Pro aminopeptidase
MHIFREDFIQMNIPKLRELFNKDNIDGYIIPHNDEYQNEYVPESNNRLKFISGFTGSNGIAIVTKDNKFFWTDGRYILQAKKEVPDFVTASRDFKEVGKARIGYNPILFTKSQLDTLSKDLTMVAISQDLIDQIWTSKPKILKSKAYLYPVKYSGMKAEEKLEIVRDNIKNSADYALITEPDSICWLLNIRGSDIEHVPLVLGYMIVGLEEVYLFTDLEKFSEEIQKEFGFIKFKNLPELFDILALIKNKILIDPTSCPVALSDLCINKAYGKNPCLTPKACKNDTEIKYAIEGHIKDAIALCEGLSWVYKTKGITEHDVSIKLTELRSKQEGYVTDSFPTIAGFRENGAVIHYRAPENGSKIIDGDGILLIDSGAHYLGCTTDVTRTIVWGTPSSEQKKRYTQVLKGHIALSSSIFPKGTLGGSLDIKARQYLWEDGENYTHGTGHGVGSMLSVHEYPRYIWSLQAQTELKEGMIVSNEPGFYKEGEFGIRIENLIYVERSSYPSFLKFETLTLVPYARDLIDIEMLTKQEKEFLRSYYSRIKKLILPSLSDDARIWCEYEMGIL